MLDATLITDGPVREYLLQGTLKNRQRQHYRFSIVLNSDQLTELQKLDLTDSNLKEWASRHNLRCTLPQLYDIANCAR